MDKLLVALMMVFVALAGCADDDPLTQNDVKDEEPTTDLFPVTNVTRLVQEAQAAGLPPIVLQESVVDAAVSFGTDLYEPTMEVCDDGSIYITGHTILVDTTGAPVFGSHDGGATWKQLPWFQDQRLPEPVHGATPPVTDEIFLTCGDDGWLYGVDITLASYPVNAWSGYGTRHSYWNFNAYDETQVAQQATDCIARPVKDRPWGAYSNGTLLLVNNPAAAQAQVGVMQAPMGLPASFGSVPDGIQWNLCAGPGGSIPGIPDLRHDGLFAVPQISAGQLHLVLGNKADVMDVTVKPVFDHRSGGEITSVYGQAAFDAHDTLFVGISQNGPVENGVRNGSLRFAVSQDSGASFQDLRFETGATPVRHFYMDANKFGPGALVVWAVDGDSGYDWYMAHLLANASGAPVLVNAFLVIDEGPRPSAHVTGAAVGPDGRAYTAMFTRSGSPLAPTTPMSVYIQTSGPTLPVDKVIVAAVQAV